MASVANSSNGLKLIKKRAKNGHFESKKTGEKRAKRVLIRKRNGRLTFYFNFFYESVNNALKPYQDPSKARLRLILLGEMQRQKS